MNKWINEWINEWISESTNIWMNVKERKGELMHMKEQRREWINWLKSVKIQNVLKTSNQLRIVIEPEWKKEGMNEWVIEWMNEWMNKQINEWMNGWMN